MIVYTLHEIAAKTKPQTKYVSDFGLNGSPMKLNPHNFNNNRSHLKKHRSTRACGSMFSVFSPTFGQNTLSIVNVFYSKKMRERAFVSVQMVTKTPFGFSQYSTVYNESRLRQRSTCKQPINNFIHF